MVMSKCIFFRLVVDSSCLHAEMSSQFALQIMFKATTTLRCKELLGTGLKWDGERFFADTYDLKNLLKLYS